LISFGNWFLEQQLNVWLMFRDFSPSNKGL